MIVTHLLGGLGNQMFQYAAGLALAERRRTVLKLDVSWFHDDPAHDNHNRYGLSCFNITEQFATQEEIDRVRGVQLTRTERWSVALARVLRLRRYALRHSAPFNWHRAPTFAFYPQFKEQPDNTYLNGMFQSEKFFADQADLLRRHFTFRYPLSPEADRLAARIRSGPSAAVHIRRGDYRRNAVYAQEIGTLDLGYYQRAVQLLREGNPEATLYIFSDDIEAVAREFAPPGRHEFVRGVTPGHAADQMRLMALCDDIAIANSTFSWWGAWLNPSAGKRVVAPEPWFNQSPHDTSDVVPSHWLRLPRQG
jgi:Glycosyl transferase family 11